MTSSDFKDHGQPRTRTGLPTGSHTSSAHGMPSSPTPARRQGGRRAGILKQRSEPGADFQGRRARDSHGRTGPKTERASLRGPADPHCSTTCSFSPAPSCTAGVGEVTGRSLAHLARMPHEVAACVVAWRRRTQSRPRDDILAAAPSWPHTEGSPASIVPANSRVYPSAARRRRGGSGSRPSRAPPSRSTRTARALGPGSSTSGCRSRRRTQSSGVLQAKVIDKARARVSSRDA
jgi:hypothetical protein